MQHDRKKKRDPNDGTKGNNVHTGEYVDVRDMEKVHAQILADKTERMRIEGLERYTGIAGNIVRRPRILGAFIMKPISSPAITSIAVRNVWCSQTMAPFIIPGIIMSILSNYTDRRSK